MPEFNAKMHQNRFRGCIGDDTKAAARLPRQRPNCIKKTKKNKIWWKTIFNMPDGILTQLHPAMWHVALGSWHWIRQMAAPCNVAGGSRMTYHWINPNVLHIGILLLVSISTISPQSTCHSAPVCEILTSAEEIVMSNCRFSRWRSPPSWILGVQ